jgi:hypothetical protein
MRRALPLLVLVLAIAPVAASCGTEPGSLDGSDEALKDAGSSRIEMDMTTSGEGSNLTYSGGGSMDYAHNRGQLSLIGKVSGEELHFIVDGPDAYFGMRLLGKVRWQKDADYEATGPDRLMPGAGGVSPDQVLELLTKLSKKVELVGDEKVRDVSTKHYRARLDLKKLGTEYREPMFDGEIVVDAWVDDDGLLRRIRLPSGSEEMPVFVLDLFDFGVDVDVQPPSADELVTADEFWRLLNRECARQQRSPNGMGQLCAVLTSDSGMSTGPTDTMPRRVSDY